MNMRPESVRIRLTFWYVGVLAGVLVVYIAAAYSFQDWQLKRQIYHDEVQDMETVEGLLYFDGAGQLHLHEEYHSRPQSRLLVDRLMEVHRPSGELLYRNDRLNGMALDSAIQPGEGYPSYNERIFQLENGERVLMISHLHPVDGQPLLIRIGYDLGPAKSRMMQFLLVLLLALPVALVVAGFAGYRIAQKALAPLGKMASQAEQITANRLHDRLPIDNEVDELGQMARVFNGLLVRLEQSFTQLQRFTSDAAHELRTPLASMRSVGEVGLQQAHTEEGYREIISSMLEETASLTQLIDGLLMMAKAESGQISVRATEFEIDDLIDEVVGLLGVIAEERGVSIRWDRGRRGTLHADRALVRLALVNVLHNAIKFSPQGAEVTITSEILKKEGQPFLRILVRDVGPGVRDTEKALVFSRFYRSEATRAQEGAGLGLSIAKWAIEANGGEILFDPHRLNGATCFIDLPLGYGWRTVV